LADFDLDRSTHSPVSKVAAKLWLEMGQLRCQLDISNGTAFGTCNLPSAYMLQGVCRKLCAVMVDTLGREVMVVKQIELDERGWPQHGADTRITSGSEVLLVAAPL